MYALYMYWTGASTTLGHGRAATLALLREMVVQNAARIPGVTHWEIRVFR